MITVALSEFMLELKDGVVKHVGAANKTAEVKLYDVEAVEARAFGDERVKLVFEEEAGSVVHVAVAPDQALALVDDVRALEADSVVFE